jgi:hypothetical protein
LTWLLAFLSWSNGLDPTSFAVYIMSPPLLLIGLIVAYRVWREDHPRHRGHPAE